MKTTKSNQLKVGSPIWVFDAKYHWVKSYKCHWIKYEIIGETRASWLYGPESRPYKLPKKGPHHGILFSEEDVEKECFVHDNAYRLSDLVRRNANYEQLKEIERIMGQ